MVAAAPPRSAALVLAGARHLTSKWACAQTHVSPSSPTHISCSLLSRFDRFSYYSELMLRTPDRLPRVGIGNRRWQPICAPHARQVTRPSCCPPCSRLPSQPRWPVWLTAAGRGAGVGQPAGSRLMGRAKQAHVLCAQHSLLRSHPAGQAQAAPANTTAAARHTSSALVRDQYRQPVCLRKLVDRALDCAVLLAAVDAHCSGGTERRLGQGTQHSAGHATEARAE